MLGMAPIARCGICREPLDVGTHRLSPKDSSQCPQTNCPQCHGIRTARCQLAIGTYFYKCLACKWDAWKTL